jgi:uncharacterized protein (TIGR03066 family)
MRAILNGSMVAVLCLGTGLLAEDKKDEKIDAKKLVGKWGPKKGGAFTFEFTKDGKATFSAPDDGKDSKGTYKVDGDKLTLTMKMGDMEQTITRTVSKLTDTELVSADERGKESTLFRIKDK